MIEPIDIVILWVDDSDEKWIEKKKYWQDEKEITTKNKERYRNWDNLQYLFRGIEKYASWVNHVYLVTDDQAPSWLDLSYKKVSVIDHKDIIIGDCLPTFNSSAIEINLHNIEGLSENFVYFNDDMFIIDETDKKDFFENGLPKDNAISNVIVPLKNQPIYKYIFNNLTIINENFNKNETIKSKPHKWFTQKNGRNVIRTLLLLPWNNFTGFYDPHICVSHKKSTFEEIWNKYDKELLMTTKSKFREDHNYTQWLMRYWNIASNNFEPRTIKFGKYFNLDKDKSVSACVSHIINQKSKIVCVNDNEFLEDFDTAKMRVNEAFSQLFPFESKFEL